MWSIVHGISLRAHSAWIYTKKSEFGQGNTPKSVNYHMKREIDFGPCFMSWQLVRIKTKAGKT